MAECLYPRDAGQATVAVHVEGEATLAATTAGNPLNRHIDVEAELQRLVRQRLAPPAETGVATSPHRSLRHRRQPLVGAFDSPEGFAFASPRR